ncbi:MAG TPA: TIGR03936 family radical SAM-associated protein [Streptosporangiaceae bacterium]|nr:TIGR03936 family radical SAM-associated protein [Streptosporangiaceae bacterium]
MSARPQPPVTSQSPVAARLVIRYAKRGRMRFASHRDLARAIERGVRRARLPIAYSAGFTPHPKISYAGAAATGTASEAEYLELSLTEARAVSDVADRLNAALPDGIDVIDVTEAPGSLSALELEASYWEVRLPGIRPDDADAAAGMFLATPSVEVERLTSKGTRRMDARAAVVTMQVIRRAADQRNAGYAILRMVVRHLTPAVRPDDILVALRRVGGLEPVSPPLVTRLAQGPVAEVAAAAGQHAPVPPHGGQTSQRGEPAAAVVQPLGRGVAQDTIKTTRRGPEPAEKAAPYPADAYDRFPRGAEGSQRTHAPGSPTGDSPDARHRAQRQRAGQ